MESAKTKKENKQSVTTPTFRASFPHLFKPSALPGAEPKYSIVMLFKKTDDLSGIKSAMKHAKIEEYGPNPKEWPQGLESPVEDGDDYPDRQGYAGHWAIKATTSQDYPPTVVDENVEEILDQKKFYPGCYARAQVYARVWKFGNKQGVHFILDAVQKVKDGEPFGGRKSAKDVFSPIENAGNNDFSDNNGEESF